MRGRAVALAALLLATAPAAASPGGLSVVRRQPDHLIVRIDGPAAGALYTISYDDGRHRFVWENLAPSETGEVRLADDSHLRPDQRLRCESRTDPADPVVFDDLIKGAVVGKRRVPFGVPVSTFGGPGYLVPGLSDLKRDRFGGFWLCLDRPPHAVLRYGPDMDYRFALLLPDSPVAFDTDADGNLYLLHPGNWVSKHGPLGENLRAWELPRGRGAGEFIAASGLAIDREGGFLYLADEALNRVQRFDLDLALRPFPFTPWGWIGREDMADARPGEYDRDRMYYLLDRPRQLVLDGRGAILVSCEHWVSRFNLATGRQEPFGRHPVLGWGGSFRDSPFSTSAGLDGHWQRHWLAGVDAAGNIYVADRENEFVIDPRLQVFDAQGALLRSFTIETDVRDAGGRRARITAVKGLACSEDGIFLVEAAGRVYRSPSSIGLVSGGELVLGPGAAGRQFDLSRAEAGRLTVGEQAGRVRRRSEGRVLAYPQGGRGTANCEREGSATIGVGERSMWTPSRMGEPFSIRLSEPDGREIPADDYTLEVEESPGIFGSRLDFFRVTNRSGRAWSDIRFVAESMG